QHRRSGRSHCGLRMYRNCAHPVHFAANLRPCGCLPRHRRRLEACLQADGDGTAGSQPPIVGLRWKLAVCAVDCLQP
ncbi:unnamed protein product, partial [Symbiodinium necroappetens]